MIARIISSAAFVSAMILIPAAAPAQSSAEPNTITVTPFLSASFGTSNDLGSSIGLGGAVGYDWTRHMGFEFEIGHVFDVAGDDETLDWALTNYHANFLYHFNTPYVTPYATFGLGWEHSNPDLEGVLEGEDIDDNSSTELAWDIGGGVKYKLNDRMLARVDLRRFQVNDAAPDHWRLYGGLTFWIKR